MKHSCNKSSVGCAFQCSYMLCTTVFCAAVHTCTTDIYGRPWYTLDVLIRSQSQFWPAMCVQCIACTCTTLVTALISNKSPTMQGSMVKEAWISQDHLGTHREVEGHHWLCSRITTPCIYCVSSCGHRPFCLCPGLPAVYAQMTQEQCYPFVFRL